MLCRPYFRRNAQQYSDEELKEITFLLNGIAFISHGQCIGDEFEDFFQGVANACGGMLEAYAGMALFKNKHSEGSSYAHTAYMDAVRLAYDWPIDSVNNILFVSREIPQQERVDPYEILLPIHEAHSINARSLTSAPVLSIQTLDILMEFAAAVLLEGSLSENTAISNYLAAAEKISHDSPPEYVQIASSSSFLPP